MDGCVSELFYVNSMVLMIIRKYNHMQTVSHKLDTIYCSVLYQSYV